MEIPSWIKAAIKEEVGDDCQIKPDITFRKKYGEVFVGFSWKLAQGVSNKTREEMFDPEKFT